MVNVQCLKFHCNVWWYVYTKLKDLMFKLILVQCFQIFLKMVLNIFNSCCKFWRNDAVIAVNVVFISCQLCMILYQHTVDGGSMLCWWSWYVMKFPKFPHPLTFFVTTPIQPRLKSWVWHENDFNPPPPPTTHTNSMSAISQLLLTRFQPNLKVRFLGWTTSTTTTITITTTTTTTCNNINNNNINNISSNSDLILN